jgi:hypothetical protein
VSAGSERNTQAKLQVLRRAACQVTPDESIEANGHVLKVEYATKQYAL